MTTNDVVAAIQNLQKEVVGLRNDRTGGIGDTFWGVAFGIVIGVPVIAVLIVAFLVGVLGSLPILD